ncbi:MAG: hypothetical protein QW341_00975 [Candidatus Bathyarchaeia archaeon]
MKTIVINARHLIDGLQFYSGLRENIVALVDADESGLYGSERGSCG